MQYCPKCNSNSGVIDTRLHKGGNIHRRRKYLKCDTRWSTMEVSIDRAAQMERAEAALLHLRKMLEMVAPTTTAL